MPAVNIGDRDSVGTRRRLMSWLAVALAIALLALFRTPGLDLLGSLLLFAVSIWNPSTPLLATAVALPFAPLRIGVLTGSVSILELLTLAAILGVLCRCFLAVTVAREWMTFRENVNRLASATFFSLGLALLLVGTLSLFTVADPTHWRESLREWRWTIAEPVAWYLAAVLWLRRPRDAQHLALLWLGGAALASVAAAIQWAVGAGLSVEGVRRLVGFYPHPNAAALALERPAMIGVVLGVLNAKPSRWIWLAGGSVALLTTLLTFSRGALLGLALTGIVVAWSVGRRRAAVLTGVVAGLGTLGALVLFPARMQAQFTAGSNALRLAIWRSAVSMLADYPITGVGLDQFLYQYAPRYIDPAVWGERFTSHPHNLILDSWLRLGLAGALLTILAIVLVIRRVRQDGAWPLDRALGAGLMVGLIHGLVDRAYFTLDLALAFWLAAVILDLPRTARSAAGNGRRQPCGCW